jgi:putative nucleotidyltransferase with HDIG domain
LAVNALLAALELRHGETERHARRVSELAMILTLALEPDLAAEPGVRAGYLLHDIGKLGVPDAILLKPGPLHELERRIVEHHPLLGEELTRSLDLPERVHEVVGCHHERWDGHGYPRGLAGEGIPLPARIFSVVDAFDAMTHVRPYREPLSVAAALREIERCSGTQFDPFVTEAFLGLSASSS